MAGPRAGETFAGSRGGWCAIADGRGATADTERILMLRTWQSFAADGIDLRIELSMSERLSFGKKT